jgi:thiamine pyrophosphate-dependent acetolactate synthase large subunit-like protein
MAQMTGGQAIVRSLKDHDVDVILGLPGVQLDNLFDAVDLPNPDFVALANSFGMAGWRVETPEALQRALTEALAARAPGLIEIPVGELPNIWTLIQRPPSQGTA